MDSGLAAGMEPVAGKIERRTIAILKPEHIAIERLGLLQVLRFDREML
ncbi:hypothetical protein HAP47_0020425 [Bradyrhizobium sp. 41S5]|nr:hypothetical protein [Bradyrhizobium sp. 41S5]UFX41684.1 hypothetical protein HAP47_0020425 [Bradyrhizobium sp. 41S5]